MPAKLGMGVMQKTAEAKGGKCLSEEYINGSSALTWICSKGHSWSSTYPTVRQGGWCPQCSEQANRDMKLDKIKRIASENSLTCVSEQYLDNQTKLEFVCVNNHTFLKAPRDFVSRPKCYICKSRNRYQKGLEEMRAIAEKRGGALLSPYYFGIAKKLKWQCALDHVWSALPYNIKKGTWCPICTRIVTDERQRKYSIEELQKHAAKFGGKILSKKYFNIAVSLKWQCSKGHVWAASVTSIVDRGSWCLTCGYGQRKKLFEQLKAIAKDRGGELLSEGYINAKTFLKWRCSKGHIFVSKPCNIKSGFWCRACALDRQKLTIEAFQNLAKSKGGKLLSEEYVDGNTHLQWQCAKGHVWSARPMGVKAGHWCRKCFADRKRGATKLFRQIAERRGGRLLSEAHINELTPLKFQCNEGHIWSTRASRIKKGSWCKICGRKAGAEKSKRTIEELQEYAGSRGGKVLTKKYITSQHHVKWECAKGHTWLATPGAVLSKKSWCGACAREKRKLSIDFFHKIAMAKGGSLLSDKYISQYTRLLWQCCEGHTWESAPKNIKEGAWCPVCNKKKIAPT